ncbi:hypothetical protein ABZ345_27895 [Lentzea sp. NPDC005914]|uniref:hypothetical protein n=1 Tax=Lentzea sp. NPDC005914 TaxID=3154572 RepID=UPI0033C87FAA
MSGRFWALQSTTKDGRPSALCPVALVVLLRSGSVSVSCYLWAAVSGYWIDE